MALVAAIAFLGCSDKSRYTKTVEGLRSGTGTEPWSLAMVRSEMTRYPESWMLDFSKAPKWSYTMEVELNAMLDAGLAYNRDDIVEYVLSYADTIIGPRGEIGGKYRMSDYNIDHVNTGKLLFRTYDMTREPKYRMALDTLYAQMQGQPRNAEGGFWHKKIYTDQMWLDGLYMGSPFLLEYAMRYVTDPTPDMEDVIHQFTLMAERSYDPATGLWKHAWDAERVQPWADPETGLSSHTWGRALGWYMMALVEAIDIFPESYAGRSKLEDILSEVAAAVAAHQDPETGLWYQAMDQPGREGNYFEATASSMFAYCLLKSARKGYISQSYANTGRKGFEGIVEHVIRIDEDGTVSLENCCAVAGLGGSTNRDGSFQYYVNEPIIDNDPKGIGPFIRAALEMEYGENGLK